MSNLARLYDEDFVRWTEAQAIALRDAAEAGANLPIDWNNLAEEVESLGKSQRRELRNRIATIIEHLVKLEHSPAAEPRAGWIETIGRERREVENLLEDSPSLRNELDGIIEREAPRTARFAADLLAARGEVDDRKVGRIKASRYTVDQVLGEWMPPGGTGGWR